jgi:hypothetical protein
MQRKKKKCKLNHVHNITNCKGASTINK